MVHEKFYVEQKYIEMAKIEQNLEYFGEAKAIWEELGLTPLMTFVKHYDPQIIAQLYATVHFSTAEERSFTWMTGNERCEATLADFGALLGYAVHGQIGRAHV